MSEKYSKDMCEKLRCVWEVKICQKSKDISEKENICQKKVK